MGQLQHTGEGGVAAGVTCNLELAHIPTLPEGQKRTFYFSVGGMQLSELCGLNARLRGGVALPRISSFLQAMRPLQRKVECPCATFNLGKEDRM
jgi:hypothetical protein